MYRIYRFFKKRYDRLTEKYRREKLINYLKSRNVDVDLDTLNIPSTVQIYADSYLHMGEYFIK